MSTAGIIFSNLNTTTRNLLTEDRTVAAIPFACRYRLVDFALSNMVNAEVANISIVTNYNYRSLRDHIGSGKDWDLARHGAGIRVVSPYQNAHHSSAKVYSSHLEALVDNTEAISNIHEDHVVICDSDIICNIDLAAVVAAHDEKGADITMVSVRGKGDRETRYQRICLDVEENGRIRDIVLSQKYDALHPEFALNIFVMRTEQLRTILMEAAAHNYKSLTRDIFMRHVGQASFYRHLHTGYYAFVTEFKEYYSRSMELLRDPIAREGLLGIKERPIFTNVHNTAPARYGECAEVKRSMIADGCTVEGTVENSILFRGVKIGKGSVVRNSILLGGTVVGKNVVLDAVVADKDTVISDGRRLAGCEELPYFIPKKKRL